MEFNKNYSDYYNKDQNIRQTTRSMSVLLLTKSAIEKLNNYSHNVNLHVSVNFLLFMANDVPSKEYCIESFQNKFKFSYLATVLFKCHDDKAIQKWYSFNGNEIKFVTKGFWEPKTRLILKEEDSLHVRRGNLRGKILRIATVKVIFFALLKFYNVKKT